MGKVLAFKTCVVRKAQKADAEIKRDRARLLIYQACNILAQQDEQSRRIAWVLEDCADSLGREASNSTSAPMPLTLCNPN